MNENAHKQGDLARTAEMQAMRGLADTYAHAADTGDGALFAAQFTRDGVLLAPRGRFEGREALRRVPDMLRARYDRTFHAVFQQVVTGPPEDRRALTYSIARHFYRDLQGRSLCYEMTIRYHDRFAREQGRLRLATRRLEIDATRSFPVDHPDTPAGPANHPERTEP